MIDKNNFNFKKMKKVILTILLVSAIWSCDKKENPIIDNTKSLQKKIDSLMLEKAKTDTFYVCKKKTIVKFVDKNIAENDFLKKENAMLVEQLCFLEEEIKQLKNKQ